MRKYLFRIILIVGFIGLSVYLLYDTYADTQHQSKLKSLRGADSAKYVADNEAGIRSARANRLKLGLDLQGGMYVTLEVDVPQMLEKMARKRDATLSQIIKETKAEAEKSEDELLNIFRRKFEERGITMSRYYGDIRNSNNEVIALLEDESKKAVDRAQEIIGNRIDQYGVSEVSIQRSGARRIIMELPGVSDEKEVRGLIQETAQLEFKLLADPKIFSSTLEKIDKLLLGQPITDEDTTAANDTTALAKADSAKTKTADTSAVAKDDAAKRRLDSIRKSNMSEQEQMAEFRKEHPFMALFAFAEYGVFANEDNKQKINRILQRDDVRDILAASDVQYAWGAKRANESDQSGQAFFQFYALKAKPELTGEVIVNARAQTDQSGIGGQAVVSMEMDAEGSRRWAAITGANVNKQIAIVLDNVVFSAPNVRQKIIGGNSQIEGMENMDEARLLEIVLKAGALPAPVQIIEERTVGPSLGEDSIDKGMMSFYIGVGAVLLFMIFYYRTAGVTADIAVLFNILFILGILAAFKATLTLPGIAGLLLTVGMAVDANVLINERVREELGLGKTLRAALDAGYARALPAIIDSNLTTIITCIILYQFGSGPIQGFALTLMIGIICSLFTAIVMTRLLFDMTLDNKPNLVQFG